MPFKSRKQQKWYNATDQDFLDDKPSSHRQVENISFDDVWRCNLCNMELEETDDIEQRKQRHEDFHKDESVGKAGARQRNWTFGKVDWTLKKPSTKTDLYEGYDEKLQKYFEDMDEIKKKKLRGDYCDCGKDTGKYWCNICRGGVEGRRGSGNTGSKVGGYHTCKDGDSLDTLWKCFGMRDEGKYKWNDNDFGKRKVGDDQSWIKFATKLGADPREAKYFFFNKMDEYWGGRKSKYHEARFVSEPDTTTNFQNNSGQARNYRSGYDYDWDNKKVLSNVDDDLLHKFLEQEWKQGERRGWVLAESINRYLSDYNHGGLYQSDTAIYFKRGNPSIAQFVRAWASKTNKALESRETRDVKIKKEMLKEMMVEEINREVTTEEFREADHPRDEDGKFTDKGGNSSSSSDSSRMEKHNKKVRGGSNLEIKEGDSEDVMTWKELRVKKIDLGHDEENEDEWWDLDHKINDLKKKIEQSKDKERYGNLDMGKITEEKIKTVLDIQDKISDEQKSRIENHFERNKEAIEKSEFGQELRKLVSEFPDLQEKIAKGRSGCSYDESTDTFDGDWEGIEMLCGASTSAVWTGMIKQFGFKSNLYNGWYDNKEGNHRRWGHTGSQGFLSEIGHAFIQLDDGTIIDPSYGQMYPTEVNVNSDMRLRIISPDDPEHENYIPEYRVFPFSGKTQKMTKDNNYGKDMPRSSHMTKDELHDVMTGKKKGGLDAKDIVMGFTSPEDRKKIKKNTMRYSDGGIDEWKNKEETTEEFKEEDHPRDENNQKFVSKGGGGSSSSDTTDYTADDPTWKDESSPRLEKELAKKIFDGIDSEYDRENLIEEALGDYPEDLGYESDLVWEDLSDEDKSKVVDYYNENEQLEWEWKSQQGMNVNGWDYKGGKPKKQSVDILSAWGHQMFGIGSRLAHGKDFEKTKIPNYPKEKPRTVEEHDKQVDKLTEQFDNKKMGKLVKKAFDYLSDNMDDLELGDMKMFKYSWRIGQQRHIEPLKQMIEQNGDPDGKLQDMIDARVPTDEKEWRRLYVLQAKTGNIGMDDFPSIKDRSEQALNMATIIRNNPEVKKLWGKAMAETDKLNQDNYDLFLKAPEFYRGTTTEELDSYLKSGNMGGEDNKYSYVSATMDRTQAVGNSEQQVANKGLERVTIIYDGDSTREKAVPLQYNAMPIEHSYNFGDPIERVDTPSGYNFYEEREIRMNENVPHPKIIGLNFGGLAVGDTQYVNPEEAEKRFNDLVEKYGSLTKNITYDQWASDREPRNIHQTLTKVGSTKEKAETDENSPKKYLNDISWSD